MILNKSLNQWIKESPLINDLINLKETIWINPKKIPCEEAIKNLPITIEDVIDASNRLERFAPYLALVFPETSAMNGIIESPLVEIPKMQAALR